MRWSAPPRSSCVLLPLLPAPPPPLPLHHSLATCTSHISSLPHCVCSVPCRVIPRSKLEAVSQHGLGYAWASFWLPAWGDCCIADPAASPVGEMRLVPDVTGGLHHYIQCARGKRGANFVLQVHVLHPPCWPLQVHLGVHVAWRAPLHAACPGLHG